MSIPVKYLFGNFCFFECTIDNNNNNNNNNVIPEVDNDRAVKFGKKTLMIPFN